MEPASVITFIAGFLHKELEIDSLPKFLVYWFVPAFLLPIIIFVCTAIAGLATGSPSITDMLRNSIIQSFISFVLAFIIRRLIDRTLPFVIPRK